MRPFSPRGRQEREAEDHGDGRRHGRLEPAEALALRGDEPPAEPLGLRDDDATERGEPDAGQEDAAEVHAGDEPDVEVLGAGEYVQHGAE